jgi:hypothetical protein
MVGVWRFLSVPAVAFLLSGCGESVDEVRKANAAADAIPAGVYSNVRLSDESGDLSGYELKLAQGSDSPVVEFVHCEGWCNAVRTAPVRRGLNGVFFEIVEGDRRVPVAVERGAGGVVVNVDWGNGLETVPLVKVEREFGLQVARGE